MKHIILFLCLTFTLPVFAQETLRDTSIESPVDTLNPSDTTDQTDKLLNPVVVFVQYHKDGTVDTLVVPQGGTIGDFTPTTKAEWTVAVEKASGLLEPLLVSLLTFLSLFFKPIRNWSANSVSRKRIHTIVVSLLVIVGGLFVKDGVSWTTWLLNNSYLPILAVGVYNLGLKNLLGNIFKKPA